jgi:preprotein translocase subunit SecF
MATVVITGRDVGLSFTGGTDIQAQATNAVLTKVNDRQVYQTLDGEAYKTVNVSGTFQLHQERNLCSQ